MGRWPSTAETTSGARFHRAWHVENVPHSRNAIIVPSVILSSLICIAAAWKGAGAPAALPASPTPWLTGSAFSQRLNEPADAVSWLDLPLRRAIHDYARAEKVAILLDRRIDPDQRIKLSLANLPLREALGRIAQHLEIGISVPGPLVYYGPAEVADRLWTLMELRRDDARKLPDGAGRSLLREERLAWPDLATPRELLAQLGARAGVEIAGLAQVPHDLWAAVDLPPLAWTDRLTLIAVQFDLTFQIAEDASRVTLVPAPDHVAIVRSFPAGRQPEQLKAKWAELAPGAQFKIVGEKIHVRARMEDLQRIAEAQRPVRPSTSRASPKTARTGPGQKVYTLNVAQAPLRKVLQQVAAALGLELRIDEPALEQAGVKLDQPVSLNVKDATAEALFDKLLTPAGCAFRLEGQTLEVRPRKAE